MGAPHGLRRERRGGGARLRVRLDRRGPTSVPTPGAPPPPTPANARPSRTVVDGYGLTGTALELLGRPYRSGGSDPTGFDCSGFTQYVFAQHGIALPREVKNQSRIGMPVKREELAPGDLVFFATIKPGASHVAIALGGDAFVHAPSSTGVVRVEPLSARYWSQRLVGARRIDREY